MENRCSVRSLYGYDLGPQAVSTVACPDAPEKEDLDSDQETWLKSVILLQSDIAERIHSPALAEDQTVFQKLIKKVDPKVMVRIGFCNQRSR